MKLVFGLPVALAAEHRAIVGELGDTWSVIELTLFRRKECIPS